VARWIEIEEDFIVPPIDGCKSREIAVDFLTSSI
jgi:hypothetical protein